MTTSSLSSPSFNSQLKNRDRAAFERAIHEHTPKLLAAAKRILRNEADAADAVQDTFLLAYMSIDSFQGRSSFYTWLYRILLNNCLMHLRGPRQRRCVSLEASKLLDRRGRVAGSVHFQSRDKTDESDRDEMAHFVRQCINELPAEYRSIILLRDIQQLGTLQTADLLCISAGAVKTRLHRARRALKRLIEGVTGRFGIRNPPARNFAFAAASNQA